MKACIVPALVGLGLVLGGQPAPAQNCGQGYRIVYRTEYEQQEVTAYRLQYETEYRHEQVTSYRPQWETETRERRYTVAKPVLETSTREDRYKVMRPVWETETREQQYTVRRPVTDTVMQNQNSVAYEQVTTMRTEYVDQGNYVDQWYYAAGPTRNRLQWLPGGYVQDPASGAMIWQRPGLHWVPMQAPGNYVVQRQYQPNIVAQQVPQTQTVAKIVTQQVPVQVTRYVDEVVTKPVQVQVCKWVEQEIVRPVTVTTQRIEYEERVEPVNVQVCRMVAETRTVQKPHTVAKWVPHTTTRLVPRTVALRVPLDDCGGCGITNYYPPSTSVYYPPLPSAPPAETRQKPTEAEKPATGQNGSEPAGDSVLKAETEGASQTDKGLEKVKPETEAEAGGTAAPSDKDATGKPRLNEPTPATPGSAPQLNPAGSEAAKTKSA